MREQNRERGLRSSAAFCLAPEDDSAAGEGVGRGLVSRSEDSARGGHAELPASAGTGTFGPQPRASPLANHGRVQRASGRCLEAAPAGAVSIRANSQSSETHEEFHRRAGSQRLPRHSSMPSSMHRRVLATPDMVQGWKSCRG